jgi:hypothetical protein
MTMASPNSDTRNVLRAWDRTRPRTLPLAARSKLSARSWRTIRPSRRADRQAHRDFAFAGRGPGQHQVGQVRARDQQHEPGDPEEQPQRRFVILAEVRDAGGGREGSEAKLAIALSAARNVGRLHGRGEHARRDRVERRRALDRPARLEPADGGNPPRAPHRKAAVGASGQPLGANRQRDVEARSDIDAEKAGRRDANHWKQLAIESKTASDDRAVAAVTALPERVAQHDARRAASRHVVGRGDQTPDDRFDVQGSEEIAADP